MLGAGGRFVKRNDVRRQGLTDDGAVVTETLAPDLPHSRARPLPQAKPRPNVVPKDGS